ncbi:MAG: alpha-glucuronidase family glycosyl hydrolase [Bacteroidota bacterium]
MRHKQCEILIGNVNRPELNTVPKEKLGKDGLFIKSSGKNLLITGGTDKGVLYGVYTFLETRLGLP